MNQSSILNLFELKEKKMIFLKISKQIGKSLKSIPKLPSSPTSVEGITKYGLLFKKTYSVSISNVLKELIRNAIQKRLKEREK